MVRPSPQTERLVEIIEMLSEAGVSGRSLAEISQHLDVNKATIYPMLTELLNVGWLVRDPRTKLFRLGPRLVAVGQAAEASFDIVDVVRPHSLSLAQKLDATCMLVSQGPQGIVVVDVASGSARARQRGSKSWAIGLKPGDTISFKPPQASVIAAWGEEGVRDSWLAHAQPEERPSLEELLAIVRKRGFAVEDFRPTPEPLGEIIHAAIGTTHGSQRARLLQQGISPAGHIQLVGELADDAEYHPVSINAPIFDTDEQVAYILLVTDLEIPVTGAQVSEIAQAVVATTRQIAAEGGHPGPN
ncbi:helix-turn-helix domain-containing protein [Brevibacterium sp. NPDC049920]|uniref:IclR family transcriptional regulator n=1 Tax=Brevibacterium sp. NPDC049920 TaxID=3155279 RepID=UPI0025CE47FC|nr:helix-turn-helix domain-containing protein [uncultured Brevibacterium sp.]